MKVNIYIENNYNPSTNPFLFLVELLLFSTRAFSKLHFFFFLTRHIKSGGKFFNLLICQVKEKEKKCSFENALVEKSESSTRNENGLG